jgi:hypothetical protein
VNFQVSDAAAMGRKEGGFWFSSCFCPAGFALLSLGFAGIRDAFLLFMRCPCAGRHLLFFAGCKEK